MRKSILHIIDTLEIGGAEQLLVGVVNKLTDFNHTIIYLKGDNLYSEKLKNVEVIQLGYKSRLSTVVAVLKLKKILKQVNPSIIHTHLPTSNYLLRLTNYKNAKVFFTTHNLLSKSLYPKSKITWYLEKYLSKKTHHAIFVSNSIKTDYEKHIGIKGKWSILYNYVGSEFIIKRNDLTKNILPGNKKKFVTVGTLKDQKNHSFLIDCFASLDPQKNELDIIGEGLERMSLNDRIVELNAQNVKLLGSKLDLHIILKDYDYFILASKYEGFGIATLEAMALGIPLILSNLAVNKEVTGGYAQFFNLGNIDSLKEVINSLKKNSEKINEDVIQGINRVKNNFTSEQYFKKIIRIYNT